jgi:hypothetical protein
MKGGICLFGALLTTFSLSYGAVPGECLRYSISIERAVETARQYTGEPFKAWLSYSKRSGYCYWKVRGSQGYVIIDARNGEVVRFYKKRR